MILQKMLKKSPRGTNIQSLSNESKISAFLCQHNKLQVSAFGMNYVF